MTSHYQRIHTQYHNLRGDSTSLFKEIIEIANEIGIDTALGLLEQCCTEKRIAWAKDKISTFERSDNPVSDGYRFFYEKYLRAQIPRDGQIIEQTEDKIVSRWWNPCPTLEACQKLNLDTRVICKKAYHQPVTTLLKHIHPNLRFERNYQKIRPHAPYCEEIIYLDSEGGSPEIPKGRQFYLER